MTTFGQKAREVIDGLTAAFDAPEKLVDTVARAALIPNNSPCIKWGPYNRFIVALHGTSDARGYRQWQEADRHVKKGAKAMHILVPRFKKLAAEEKHDEEPDDVAQILVGFVAAPVFAVEDTDGEPLPQHEPPQLPKLQAVADALGISVKYTGAVDRSVLGVYNHLGRITLYTHDVGVFYHELSHALHHRTGKLRTGRGEAEKRNNEIVAEISAAVLVRLFEGEEIGRQALGYIKSYEATKTRLLKLLPEIVEVVDIAIRIEQQEAPLVANAV